MLRCGRRRRLGCRWRRKWTLRLMRNTWRAATHQKIMGARQRPRFNDRVPAAGRAVGSGSAAARRQRGDGRGVERAEIGALAADGNG
uniref:Uncharacterized protein n=1 Tax=Oryza glumipatula TaxID=40148 RepID=A0A0E0A0E6_9ORYZ